MIAICALVAMPLRGAHAQDITPPMPDAGYAASGSASAEVPMPDIDPGGDGTVVSVPIPGGGTVTVEGPPTSGDNQPPTPIETWSEQQNTPNTVMPSPIGP
jgi:hypothetical protein